MLCRAVPAHRALCPHPVAHPLLSAAPHPCVHPAVRDKYRGHQWFQVAATTPYERLPASLLAAADAPRSNPAAV